MWAQIAIIFIRECERGTWYSIKLGYLYFNKTDRVKTFLVKNIYNSADQRLNSYVNTGQYGGLQSVRLVQSVAWGSDNPRVCPGSGVRGVTGVAGVIRIPYTGSNPVATH